MALPTNYVDRFVANLVQQCEVTRVPASASGDSKRQTCPSARGDTALADPGRGGLPPRRTP